MEKKTFTINVDTTDNDMRTAAVHLASCNLAEFSLETKNENGVDIRIFKCPHAEATVIGEAFARFAEIYLEAKQEYENVLLTESLIAAGKEVPEMME